MNNDIDLKILDLLDRAQKQAQPSRTIGSGGKSISLNQKEISINTSTPTTFGDMRRDEMGEVSHQGISSDQYNLMIFADSPTDM